MAGLGNVNSGMDYSIFFGGSQSTSASSSFDLTSYMSIKNGSYRKLLRNFYSSQKAEAKASVGDTQNSLTKIRSSADSLKKKADALSSDKLWETTSESDEASGQAKEVLKDPDALVKAVKEFADAYNSALDAAASSQTKAVLRNGGWMDNMTQKNSHLLEKAGISVGSNGKLSVNEDELKNADVCTLKNLFKGADSYAAKVSAKSTALSNAAANAEATYTSDGSWNKSVSSIASSQIDSVIGSSSGSNSTSGSKSRENAEKELKRLKEERESLQKELGKASGYDQTREYEQRIKKLDNEIKQAENSLLFM